MCSANLPRQGCRLLRARGQLLEQHEDQRPLCDPCPHCQQPEHRLHQPDQVRVLQTPGPAESVLSLSFSPFTHAASSHLRTPLFLLLACSSYLMTLVPTGAATLTMTYWPATTDVSKAAAVSASSQVRRPVGSSPGALLHWSVHGDNKNTVIAAHRQFCCLAYCLRLADMLWHCGGHWWASEWRANDTRCLPGRLL
jgi:hypothetical protein